MGSRYVEKWEVPDAIITELPRRKKTNDTNKTASVYYMETRRNTNGIACVSVRPYSQKGDTIVSQNYTGV